VGSATLAYNFVYLAVRKQGDPRGWRCLKNSRYKYPFKKKQSESEDETKELSEIYYPLFP